MKEKKSYIYIYVYTGLYILFWISTIKFVKKSYVSKTNLYV